MTKKVLFGFNDASLDKRYEYYWKSPWNFWRGFLKINNDVKLSKDFIQLIDAML